MSHHEDLSEGRYLAPEGEALPMSISFDPSESVLSYWRRRIEQHLSEYYAGIRLSKFPEDLRVMEQLMFAQRPQAVVELGCQFASSSLWFADRLEALVRYGGAADPVVVAVDIDTSLAEQALDGVDPRWRERILLIEADITDPALPALVESRLEGRTNCFVIEDSAHVYDTTAAALRGFTHLVPPGGYVVVEDGVVDVEELRMREDWPRGVHRAIDDFMAGPSGRDFIRRPDLERYGITSHPGGYLQRRV